MPPLGPQHYEDGAGYDAPTATVRPASLAAAIGDVVRRLATALSMLPDMPVRGASLQLSLPALAFLPIDRHTRTEFTVTARNKTGTWSGWSGKAETQFIAST